MGDSGVWAIAAGGSTWRQRSAAARARSCLLCAQSSFLLALKALPVAFLESASQLSVSRSLAGEAARGTGIRTTQLCREWKTGC